jgi:hypothetical protein
VKLAIAVLLAAALAATAAGNARADGVAPPTVRCADGTMWVLDPVDVDSVGLLLCAGEYVLVEELDATGTTPDDSAAPSVGVDVGFGADPNMDPDPAEYGTEVRCPDGTVWAVPIGDDFVCPAA